MRSAFRVARLVCLATLIIYPSPDEWVKPCLGEAMKLQLVATCLFGLEHLLGEEIDALGYERISTINGRVTFLGDEEAVALSNVFLRYAERIYIKVGSFNAPTFDALFEGTRALNWADFIGRNDAFPVSGHSIRSALHSIPDCQAIVKKAIVRSMSERYGISVFPRRELNTASSFLSSTMRLRL